MNTKYISKIFSGAIFSGIVMLALFGISASNANAQNNTRKVTIKKDVCSSINPNSNACNGPNTELADVIIQFTVEQGTLSGTTFTPTGTLPNIPVKIDGCGGSCGSATADLSVTSNVVRICEIPPPNFDATPQPESSTGGSDTFAQGDCIITLLGNGNNIAQFANARIFLVPTAATAMVAGRVSVNTGLLRGNGRVLVTILNTRTSETQVVFTNRLGYYEFNDLPVGDTYVVSVRSKGYSFTPQTFFLTEDNALDMFGSALGRSIR
jgi:hypothetical protein